MIAAEASILDFSLANCKVQNRRYGMSMIEGALPLQRGQSMAGRAVTLRFVPHRPDLAQDKPKREFSAEYVAFELCGGIIGHNQR